MYTIYCTLYVLQGVPVRIELGPRDVAQGKFVVERRDTGAKSDIKRSEAVSGCRAILDTIQSSLYNR